MPISSHELKHFASDTKFFVECGSAGFGSGISAALHAGFERVYSVEIDPVVYAECYGLFGHDPKVELSLGDCGVWLDKTLDKIAQPCVTYLDANGFYGETESPFHASINAMVRHGAKHHIILVDDMNHAFMSHKKVLDDLRRSRQSGAEHETINQLLRVNAEYVFYLIDTHSEDFNTTYPSWVLVAECSRGRFTDAEYV